MRKILLDDSGPIKRPLWDPRTGRMEETNNRALQLLDRLMDSPGVDIEALKRVADICEAEGEVPRRGESRTIGPCLLDLVPLRPPTMVL